MLLSGRKIVVGITVWGRQQEGRSKFTVINTGNGNVETQLFHTLIVWVYKRMDLDNTLCLMLGPRWDFSSFVSYPKCCNNNNNNNALIHAFAGNGSLWIHTHPSQVRKGSDEEFQEAVTVDAIQDSQIPNRQQGTYKEVGERDKWRIQWAASQEKETEDSSGCESKHAIGWCRSKRNGEGGRRQVWSC